MVNNSSLPRSMMKERKIFAVGVKNAKLSTGPTLPIAGPTFPRHVAVAPRDVSKSYPMIESVNAQNTNNKR